MAVAGDDLGVATRKIAVLDGDRTVGGAPDGDSRSLQLLPEGGEQRRVHRDLRARIRSCHSRVWHLNIALSWPPTTSTRSRDTSRRAAERRSSSRPKTGR